MAEHYLRFENKLGTDENDSIEDILRNVEDEDELIISMNADEVEHSDHIVDVLRNNGFEILPKGGHEDQQYHIVAHRKKK